MCYGFGLQPLKQKLPSIRNFGSHVPLTEEQLLPPVSIIHHTYVSFSYIKVKESRNRPGVAQRVPGGLGSQIS
jgi:hypothetical protein